MMLWKAASKPGPANVQITNYGWEVTKNDEVMSVIAKQPVAPGMLMDVISCGCKR
jgi:uncharacterized protein CbrC (UPF0167 family)